MIILDTNVLSELLRPTPAAQVEAWLSEQDGAMVYFTAVGEAELRYGLAILPPGRRHVSLSKAINNILDEDFRDRVLSFDQRAARAYAAIAADRRASGRPISQFDCQIAAIARANEGAVATRNSVDFEGCGITLIDPWQHRSLDL
jgi:predicted nucleic acid-binding protein